MWKEGRKEEKKEEKTQREEFVYIYTHAGPNQCIYYIYYTCTYNVRRRRGRTTRRMCIYDIRRKNVRRGVE